MQCWRRGRGSTPAAAVRETREETGIDFESSGLVGIYSYPGHVIAYDDGEVRQEFSICFRARQVGGAVTTSDESTQVHWAEPAEIDGLAMHPRMRVRVEDGLRGDPQPYLG